MEKKTRRPASGPAKRSKRAARRKASPPTSASVPRRADGFTEAKRLRKKLKEALAHIEELEASANTDFLLEIPNRRGFEHELNRAIAYMQRYDVGGALVALDVDRLKPINDSFGHAAGDEVLKAIVAVLLRQVRSSDVIGRLGGDEFALLLWNLSETDAHAKAASLEQAIDALRFRFDGRAVSTGASAGVAMLGPHSQAARALEQADCAMYVRKARRRHETQGVISSPPLPLIPADRAGS